MTSWTNKRYDFFDPFTNVSTADRWLRVVMGSMLIGSVFVADQSPLGWIATLPLAGTFPVLTAIIGYDPLYRMLAVLMERKPRIAFTRLETERNTVSKTYSRAA